MTPEFAIWVCKETVYTALLVAAPMLLAGLVIGVAVSLFQAVTQINEMTLSFIPKILAVAGVMLFTMPWMIRVVLGFTRHIMALMASPVM